MYIYVNTCDFAIVLFQSLENLVTSETDEVGLGLLQVLFWVLKKVLKKVFLPESHEKSTQKSTKKSAQVEK